MCRGLGQSRQAAALNANIRRGIRCRTNLKLLCCRPGNAECVMERVRWVSDEKGTTLSAEEAAYIYSMLESLEEALYKYSIHWVAELT